MRAIPCSECSKTRVHLLEDQTIQCECGRILPAVWKRVYKDRKHYDREWKRRYRARKKAEKDGSNIV